MGTLIRRRTSDASKERADRCDSMKECSYVEISISSGQIGWMSEHDYATDEAARGNAGRQCRKRA
jgi:hypothetical protein